MFSATMIEAHCFSILIIGVGSFLSGMLPAWLSIRVNRFYSFLLPLMLCFGGGVLLATSLVHMLSEVQEKLKSFPQLFFCAGFLLLFILDEITHLCCEGKNFEINDNQPDERLQNEVHSDKANYGATENNDQLGESSHLLDSNDMNRIFHNSEDQSNGHLEFKCRHENLFCSCIITRDANNQNESRTTFSSHQMMRCNGDIGLTSSIMAKTGLLIALMIHSTLEGISIGIQTNVSQVFLMLGAVSFHKLVLSFCLGLELLSNKCKQVQILMAILLFSIGSPIGILIGMLVNSSSKIFTLDAQLQAIAAGSLLYVAAFEVLPRERFNRQKRKDQKASGIFQLIFLLFGFFCITAVHFFLAPLHKDEAINHNTTIKSIG